MTRQLPEGTEVTLSCYFTSDSLGTNAVVSATSRMVPNVEEMHARLAALGAAIPGATDWRSMTAEEVKAYKADLENDDD